MNAAECRQLGEMRLESPENHCHSGQYFSLVGEGKINVFPLLARSILDLQVETACAHARLALGAPSRTCPTGTCSFQVAAEHPAG